MSDGTSAKLRPASHTFVDVLRVIRAPLFFAIVAFLLFWLPGQSREVYRIVANEPFEHITEVVVSLAALTVLTAVLWYNCVVALRWQKLIAPAESEAALNVKFRAVDLVSILPVAGVVAGFLADSSSETMPIFLILVLLLVGGLISSSTSSVQSCLVEWIGGNKPSRSPRPDGRTWTGLRAVFYPVRCVRTLARRCFSECAGPNWRDLSLHRVRSNADMLAIAQLQPERHTSSSFPGRLRCGFVALGRFGWIPTCVCCSQRIGQVAESLVCIHRMARGERTRHCAIYDRRTQVSGFHCDS